ncbi:pentapeptide repeat-containing protein [Streptomyces sp. NBC_01142]|uniref:pentapeptide repeat-containing protein n=1 Tax=Streptomyces sp. NBC_01142 TaxID=2975865 RepID=UPI00225567AE|nr:pentapeptide repeat-containing protein [Streptomyces sp. NBC_01142]MCX4826944.1 pentapeptide repeat-containing protein [Streptomyces sp. NBC_01142]
MRAGERTAVAGEEPSAQAALITALRDLKGKARLGDNGHIIRYGERHSPRVDFKSSTLSDWFTGQSVPSDPVSFRALIDFLQEQARRKSGRPTTPWQWWETLRMAAREERRQQGRPRLPHEVLAADHAATPAGLVSVMTPAVPGPEPDGTAGPQHDQPADPVQIPAQITTAAAAVRVQPPWPVCESGAPHCLGRRVEPYQGCLPHLAAGEREAYLNSLGPGSDIDLRGTVVTHDALTDLLNRTRINGRPHLGRTQWDSARFAGEADFARVIFKGPCSFSDVTFVGDTDFAGATFEADADFTGSTFTDNAWFNAALWNGKSLFDEVTFSGTTSFDSASLRLGRFAYVSFGEVHFNRATFAEGAEFPGCTFGGRADFTATAFASHARFQASTFSAEAAFDQTVFSTNADFNGVAFGNVHELGPLTCEGTLDLTGALFTGPVGVAASAARVVCRRTRFESASMLTLRHAEVIVEDVALNWPLEIVSSGSPLVAKDGSAVADPSNDDPAVRLLSLRGTDAAHLALRDLDLSRCHFNGAFHLDLIHLSGRCRFASTPLGVRWRRGLPVTFKRRAALAEEHHWHAARGRQGWIPAPAGTEILAAEQLHYLYQSLRSAAESQHRPEALDFAYGQKEFRRHDPANPLPERLLLFFHWLVSGYGLRVRRILMCLAASIAASMVVLMLWGLPKSPIDPQLRGSPTSLQSARPVPPDQALTHRLTPGRFEQSLRVVLHAALLRPSPIPLTAAGTYAELSCRMAEPGLVLLAVLTLRRRTRASG